MRVYIAVFVLCIIAAIMTSEPHNSATLAKGSSQTQAQGNVIPAQKADQNCQPCNNPAKTDDNSPKWYTPLKRPEWWLVILGFPTLGFLIYQAIVSGIAARAAEKNTELYINKERARLRIEMAPLVLPTPDSPFNTVDFTVSVYGQTDAFITDNLCVAGIGPPEFINYPELWDRVMFPIHSLPSVVVANAAPTECSALLGPNDGPHELIVGEVKAKRMFVCIRGFIKYKDVFDRDRETAFRYVWRYSEAVADYGQWEKCGQPEENRET